MQLMVACKIFEWVELSLPITWWVIVTPMNWELNTGWKKVRIVCPEAWFLLAFWRLEIRSRNVLIDALIWSTSKYCCDLIRAYVCLSVYVKCMTTTKYNIEYIHYSLVSQATNFCLKLISWYTIPLGTCQEG